MNLALKIFELILTGVLSGIVKYFRERQRDELLQGKGRAEVERENAIETSLRADRVGQAAANSLTRDKLLGRLRDGSI